MVVYRNNENCFSLEQHTALFAYFVALSAHTYVQGGIHMGMDQDYTKDGP